MQIGHYPLPRQGRDGEAFRFTETKRRRLTKSAIRRSDRRTRPAEARDSCGGEVSASFAHRPSSLRIAASSADSDFTTSRFAAATFRFSERSSPKLKSSGPTFLRPALGMSFHFPLRMASAPPPA